MQNIGREFLFSNRLHAIKEMNHVFVEVNMIMSIRLKYNGMEYAKADHHKINCFIYCNACIVCAIKMCVRYHEGYIENKTVGKYKKRRR